jgi:deoxyribonuclease-1
MPAPAQTVQSSWRATTNSAADDVYHDNDKMLYCGCTYESHGDSDGSGDVDLPACGMAALDKYVNRAQRIEWEHIVPASLMPAHSFACWQNPEQFDDCHEADGDVIKGRACCEKISAAARQMIFDRHNLRSVK